MWQIVVNGAEGWLARGWGVVELHEVGELDIDFFEFSDGMAQSAETGRAIGQ